MTSIVTLSIEEEIKKHPELKESDINHLREWCKSQPHLPELTDSELIRFFHSTYYQLESTKVAIDAYYTHKTQAPEFFADRDPINNTDFRRIFSVASVIPLKQVTKEGYHIILARVTDPDTTNYVFNYSMKLFLMAFELWMYSSEILEGHVIVFDVQNINMGHATRISPISLKKCLNFLQDGLPVRLKGLHFMNITSAMKVILRVMKPFMKKELTEMLQLHTTLETIENYLPIEGFPNELGGKAGPMMELHKVEIKKIEEHRNWFLEDELRARVDESKRPKKVKSTTKQSSLAGNFVKLDID